MSYSTKFVDIINKKKCKHKYCCLNDYFKVNVFLRNSKHTKKNLV